MIVRLSGEGQFEVPDDLLEQLNEHDRRATEALDREDGADLGEHLRQIAELVRSSGRELADDELVTSAVVIPPSDLTLDEARRLMTSPEGLIPDPPVATG
jgi:hypothetical protein